MSAARISIMALIIEGLCLIERLAARRKRFHAREKLAGRGQRNDRVDEFDRLVAERRLVARFADAEVKTPEPAPSEIGERFAQQKIAGAATGDRGIVIVGVDQAVPVPALRQAAEDRRDGGADAQHIEFQRRFTRRIAGGRSEVFEEGRASGVAEAGGGAAFGEPGLLLRHEGRHDVRRLRGRGPLENHRAERGQTRRLRAQLLAGGARFARREIAVRVPAEIRAERGAGRRRGLREGEGVLSAAP